MNHVTIASISFVVGSFTAVIPIYLLGGSYFALFFLGLMLAILTVATTVCLWPKEIARFLWAYARVWEDSKSRLNHSYKEADKELGRRKDDPKPNPLVGDVISALVNLGTPEKKAKALVEEVVAYQEYGSFEELFQATMRVRGTI